MADSPPTRPSLLVRLRDARDGLAWAQFVELYAPLIYAYGRRQGLQDADAADLTQESLRVVSEAIQALEYDRQRGTFRAWLFAVVRNRLRAFRARQGRAGRGSGDSTVHERLAALPDQETPDEDWDRDYDRRRFRWAAEQVRGQVQPATWLAFWRTAVEGKSGQETAAELGMSVAAVYLARSRVMARLREVVRELPED
jgi:RNA polymerase sigma-70 factor (ECF subfamily)